MRGDLKKLEAAGKITDIKTDVATKSGSFKVTDENFDVQAKLAEIAETNTHMKGWSVVQ